MPSHQDNLAAVRAACIAANESLEYRVCSWCGRKYGKTNDVKCSSCSNMNLLLKVREIGVSDVLLALGNKNACIAVRADGQICDTDSDYGGSRFFTGYWNLRLTLSGQSEETVAYLAALLKPNDKR